MDSSTLCLPGDQNDWFLLIRQMKKPIVTVIIAGRPYAILKIAEQTDGLLYSFYPGPYGGLALAKLIYGEESPSGVCQFQFRLMSDSCLSITIRSVLMRQ